MDATGTAADGPEVRRLLLGALAIAAVQPLVFLGQLLTEPVGLYPDFFALWSFGRYAAALDPATMYDEGAMHAFQAGFGLQDNAHYPFLYPPWILLLLTPLGALPYGVARVAWQVMTFAAFVTAVGAWRWPWRVQALLVLAPSSVVCVLVGQNGFLSAAILLGGWRLLPFRPVLAGAVLAGVAYKPTLAVLLPFALLFGLHWRAIAGGIAGAVALTLASIAASGAGIWLAWIGYMRQQSANLSVGLDGLLDMMPTPAAAVRALGGTPGWAHAAELLGLALALAALWRTRRRHDAAARAVLPLATVLATPYAFHYDLSAVSGAVLAVIAERIAAAGRLGAMELPLLLAALLLPSFLPTHVAGAGAGIAVVYAAALWVLASPTRAPLSFGASGF